MANEVDNNYVFIIVFENFDLYDNFVRRKLGRAQAITAKINELQSALEDSKKKVKNLEAQLAFKEMNEAKLVSKMEEDKAKIKRFQEKLEGRERTIKDLKDQIGLKEKNEADLESKIAKNGRAS